MRSEDPDTTKKFNPEDASQSSYSQSSTSTTSINSAISIISSSGKKKYQKPTYHRYFKKFGQDHADVWKQYTEWKKRLPKEDTGTSRDLFEQEAQYFNFHKKYYEFLPTTRKKTHHFTAPPKSWRNRFDSFQQPSSFETLMESIIEFSNSYCSSSERNNWNLVLEPLPRGSLRCVLWAIAFLKSTNGVADKVSCGHFMKLIRKNPDISLQLYEDPYRIAALIRQTSKWVKNTYVLMNIFSHIHNKWNGVPSKNFHEWLNFYEIGPKTAALLFHSAFDTESLPALPVDSHVWFAFKKWKWTNAKTPNECSWQASKWIPPSYFIKTNDAIGSIRQTLADKRLKKRLLREIDNISTHEVKELLYALI